MAPKVTARDEALAPSAQPDVAVRLVFPLRHEAFDFHIGALCSTLPDIGVKPIYPSRCHSSADVGFQVASEVSHLIRAWRRHNCCFDVRSDSKRSAPNICSKNLRGVLVDSRMVVGPDNSLN